MVDASGERAVQRCDQLGVQPYSDMTEGLYRAYLTPAHAAAINRIIGWMSEAGMSTRLDAAGNLIGRYEAREEGAPALVIGSHIDSVYDAGRYDGPLGVMLGIECVAALNAGDKRLSYAIEIVAFGDEEGSRFPVSMICSRAVAGTLDTTALGVVDNGGRTLEEAFELFREWVFIPVPDLPIAAAERGSDEVFAYLEAHIEQGPVLEAEDLAVGAVAGIAGQMRFEVVVSGKAAHAGTTTMGLRRDALAGAAEMIVAIEAIIGDLGRDLVATVGQIDAFPKSTNVVPGRVVFSLDVRSLEPSLRRDAAEMIEADLVRIAARRDLELSFTKLQDLASSPCDEDLTSLLEDAMARAGHPRRALVSGAGHDAMIMSNLCPTAMLFVRCRGGVSHNPAEHASIADTDAALRVMLEFLDLLETHRS